MYRRNWEIYFCYFIIKSIILYHLIKIIMLFYHKMYMYGNIYIDFSHFLHKKVFVCPKFVK